MDGKQKLFLVVLGILMVIVAVRYGLSVLVPQEIKPADIQVTERTTEEVEASKTEEVEKVYVNIFFIGQNENREEVYKAVKREYDQEIDGSKLKFAINSLVAGPKENERNKGVYTEIPAGTDVISIKELPDKAIINLSAEFEYGGGTDSLYKRLYQLIKTARRNSEVPVYLYIEGQRADVIGGEGIMLSQPLSDRSLDG
ncbi:GerMN domain-containing protein [bacterium]|nr:GerMN domain-containing protein [bacterium]